MVLCSAFHQTSHYSKRQHSQKGQTQDQATTIKQSCTQGHDRCIAEQHTHH